MGKLSKSPALVCPICKSVVELLSDGAYGFDVAQWSSQCRHSLAGSPILCRHFGPDLHSTMTIGLDDPGPRRDEH